MKRFLHKARSIIFLDGDDVRRAPMAAALFESLVSGDLILKLWDVKVDSAGSGKYTKEGASPDSLATRAMFDLGLEIASHRAKALSLEMIEETSIILAMEQKHIDYVTQYVSAGYPGYNNKMFPLSSYVGAEDEIEKLIDTKSPKKYKDFTTQMKSFLRRVAYMIKYETLRPLLLKGQGVSTGALEGKVKLVRSPKPIAKAPQYLSDLRGILG